MRAIVPIVVAQDMALSDLFSFGSFIIFLL